MHDDKLNRGTFLPEDVTLLLTDITGTISPLPTKERERLIQSGVHYSEMLPCEYEPTERYLAQYSLALDKFSGEVAKAVAIVAEKIYFSKQRNPVIVSLARAGTPAGILIKRYLQRKYGTDIPHYTISIVRGRGIDAAAMSYILSRHNAENIQFTDGWTGKGAILDELHSAARAYPTVEKNKRLLLAVIADPANITDMCGTHEDIPIASSFLNATVCGLMSRTVIRPETGSGEYHGTVFYNNLRGEDRTYEFIGHIEGRFPKDISEINAPEAVSEEFNGLYGIEEIREIAEKFAVSDINFIKPGIGETTRVLLRRVPDMILTAENAEPKYIAHLIQLAEEKCVPVVHYPLRRYAACGIIKALEL